MRDFQVSGRFVFWWMERSGILQNAGGGKVSRGLIAESTMPLPVIAFDEDGGVGTNCDSSESTASLWRGDVKAFRWATGFMSPNLASTENKSKYRFGRLALNVFIVGAFGAPLYLGIRLLLDRRWVVSFFPVTLALMLIPFADHSYTLRERLRFSLTMPLLLAAWPCSPFSTSKCSAFTGSRSSSMTKVPGHWVCSPPLLGIVVGAVVGFQIIRLSGLFHDVNTGRPT